MDLGSWTLLYQELHNLLAFEISAYVTAITTTTTHLTRFQHPFHFNIPTASIILS